MVFNILATFAESEVDLLRLRTREGTAVARATGKLKGKRPSSLHRQQAELTRMHATDEYTIADLMEVLLCGAAPPSTAPPRANPCPWRRNALSLGQRCRPAAAGPPRSCPECPAQARWPIQRITGRLLLV